jgi:integrase
MATIEPYRTASGEMRYSVRFRTPQHRQTRKRGFKTKREAQLFAATVEVDKSRGQFISTSAGRATIGELGPSWLARQHGHIKPSGFRSLDSAWRVHVAPRWGRVRIGDVRFSDVQAWVAGLSGQLSASMVANVYSVLARILDDAVRDRQLAVNPARGVKLPRRAPRRNVYLTAAQLDRLADEAGRYRSLVLLLGVGGVRWGEAAALRVGDVDFLRRRVALHRNAVKVGRQFAVGSLKSNKSRTVALPAFVMNALAQTARGKGRDDLLWPSAVGGYLAPPAGNDSWLSGAVGRCQKADKSFPRVTAHDLRHTAASLAISAGANPKVVQRMLGHASAAMTLDVYTDLFESDLDDVAVTVSKMCPRWSASQ